jgi:hypothetical protein
MIFMVKNVVSIEEITGNANETLPKRSGEWRFRAEALLGRLLSKLGFPGMVKPLEYEDSYTGNHLKITTSALFTIISINGRDYWFHRLSGRFDGTGSGCA